MNWKSCPEAKLTSGRVLKYCLRFLTFCTLPLILYTVFRLNSQEYAFVFFFFVYLVSYQIPAESYLFTDPTVFTRGSASSTLMMSGSLLGLLQCVVPRKPRTQVSPKNVTSSTALCSNSGVIATETGSMYGFQARSTHPTGMFSGCSLIFVAAQCEH